MHKSALFTTLSLLSALAPASAQGHFHHKRHAHPAKVVVTDLKTVVVEQGEPTPSAPAGSPLSLVNNAVVANYNPPPAKQSSLSKVVGGIQPTTTQVGVYKPTTTQAGVYKPTTTQASGYKPPTSQAAPSGPSPSSGTGGGNGAYGGTVTLHNDCDYDVWLWVDNGAVETTKGKWIPKKGTHQEAKQYPSAANCGVVFKVSRTPDLRGDTQLQFEYSLNFVSGMQFNDISFVNCAIQNDTVSDQEKAKNCPGWAHGLAIRGPSNCGRQIYCEPGQYCPKEAYYVSQPYITLKIPEPSYSCGSNSNTLDTDFYMCSSGLSKRSIAGRLEVEEKF